MKYYNIIIALEIFFIVASSLQMVKCNLVMGRILHPHPHPRNIRTILDIRIRIRIRGCRKLHIRIFRIRGFWNDIRKDIRIRGCPKNDISDGANIRIRIRTRGTSALFQTSASAFASADVENYTSAYKSASADFGNVTSAKTSASADVQKMTSDPSLKCMVNYFIKPLS